MKSVNANTIFCAELCNVEVGSIAVESVCGNLEIKIYDRTDKLIIQYPIAGDYQIVNRSSLSKHISIFDWVRDEKDNRHHIGMAYEKGRIWTYINGEAVFTTTIKSTEKLKKANSK